MPTVFRRRRRLLHFAIHFWDIPRSSDYDNDCVTLRRADVEGSHHKKPEMTRLDTTNLFFLKKALDFDADWSHFQLTSN